MIGLGLGIDYSLLVLARFREELRVGHERELAAREALRHAGPTILLSGCAVAIGFSALGRHARQRAAFGCGWRTARDWRLDARGNDAATGNSRGARPPGGCRTLATRERQRRDPDLDGMRGPTSSRVIQSAY